MPPKIQITLMRHGRSRADDEMVHEGRYDSPLTDVGREQVKSRAQGWMDASITFDTIVASTLIRASESAHIVAEILDVPVEHDPDWMERDNGQLAGRPIGTKEGNLYPIKTVEPFQPYDIVSRKGESAWDLMGRSARALQGVVRRGEGSFLVVAHGGVLNAAMSCIFGTLSSPGVNGVHFRFADAGFVKVLYEPEKQLWTICGMSS